MFSVVFIWKTIPHGWLYVKKEDAFGIHGDRVVVSPPESDYLGTIDSSSKRGTGALGGQVCSGKFDNQPTVLKGAAP